MFTGTSQDLLVPVDFSIYTEVAIRHAVALASVYGSAIHLLHVIQPALFSQMDSTELKKKLMQWKTSIEETVPQSSVTTYVAEGSTDETILAMAKKLNPQLIIMGSRGSSGMFSFNASHYPNELAKLTGCPVLTVTEVSANSNIKLIVVPVRSFVPERKIDLLVLFAKMTRASVHVVTLENLLSPDSTQKSALLDTFRILTTLLHGTVKYHLLKGRNFARATLDYAEEVGADMILVNPWAESQLSKFTGKHIQNVLTGSSRIKVLSVEPYHNFNNVHF